MYSGYIALGAVFFLSLIGHNMSVAYASGIMIVIKLLGLTSILQTLGAHGLNWGIILLTMAILVPIATDSITFQNILDSFKTPLGIIAMTSGVLAASVAGYGVDLLQNSPEVVSALIIGTMVGVFFFKGLAVGPLIAAGFTYIVLQVWKAWN